jgi:cobalt/nickel transport system permease protein
MSEQSFVPGGQSRRRHFAQRLVHIMEHALDAESVGSQRGLLQGLDPRIKLISILTLIISGVLTRSLSVLAALFLLALVLAFLSRITAARLCKQVWIGVLLFTGIIALPSLVVVPGLALWQIPLVDWSVTYQGLRSAAFLVGRAETSATFALLLVLSTPWTHVLKAMRSLGVPVVVVAILGMTYRYIFLLLQIATQLFEARRSRIVAPMKGPQQRRMVIAAVGVLLGKAFQLGADVHLAMLSRGYRGEVHLLHDFQTRRRDWFALLSVLTVPALILWFQA